MNLNDFKVDRAKVEQGEWIDGENGLRLLVRGIDNATARRLRNKLVMALPLSDLDENGSPSPEANDRILAQVADEAILLGWEGLKLDDEPVPYSREKASEFLRDPDYLRFVHAVNGAATRVGTVRAKKAKADEGN